MHAQPKHRTIRSWVYDTLRERIISGELGPGEALVEARLAEDLGISRSPIREALRQLGQEGFVRTLQNSATTVATCDAFEVEQIFEMRDLLESSLVAHAAVARSDEEVTDCRAVIAQMRALADVGEREQFEQLDRELHQRLWTMARRPRVAETITPIADHARRYMNVATRELNYERPATMRMSCDEHEAMLDAIADRDVARAVEAARTHMRGSRQRVLKGVHLQAEDGHLFVEDELDRYTSVYDVLWTGVST